MICVGKDNSYGHPTNEVLTRLENRNIKVYRTDLNGTIIMKSNGEDISIKTVKTDTDGNTNKSTNESNTSNVDNENLNSSEEKSIIVYVTNSGKKYHKQGCSYLKSSKIQIELEEAVNGGYEPCSICKPQVI